MKIVVMVNGEPKGPFDVGALKQAIEQGEILPSALAWQEGQDNWIELRNMPELKVALAAAPGAAGATGVGVVEVEPPFTGTAPKEAEPAGIQWYYLIGDKTLGPSTTADIKHYMASGAIPSSTYVFHAAMKEWAEAYTLQEFKAAIGPEDIQQTEAVKSHYLDMATSLGPLVIDCISKESPKPSQDPRTQCSFEAPDRERPSVVESGKLFSWWPFSILGSAALAALLTLLINVFVTAILVVIKAFEIAPAFANTSVVWALCIAGLLLIGYVGPIMLRRMLVVAPYRRQLRRCGFDTSVHKLNFFDVILDNSRKFIITGLVVAVVMFCSIVACTLNIPAHREGLVEKENAARSLQHSMQHSLEQNAYERESETRRKAGETARAYNMYRNNRESEEDARSLAEQYVQMFYHPTPYASDAEMESEGARIKSQEMVLLSGAVVDAMNISASKGLRVWAIFAAAVALFFSLWIMFQARKEAPKVQSSPVKGEVN